MNLSLRFGRSIFLQAPFHFLLKLRRSRFCTLITQVARSHDAKKILQI
jgi:hypothetical protein